MDSKDSNDEHGRLGVWLIGARGSIATSVVYGLTGLQRGLLEPLGLTSTVEPLKHLPLRDLDAILFGGHEVSMVDLTASAGELARNGVLPQELLAACATEAAAYDARIRPGVLDGPDVGMAHLHPTSQELGAMSPRGKAERLRADLEAFQQENDLERVVVVNLASTEAWREKSPEWTQDLSGFEAALDGAAEVPASCLYAYAALQAGMPFVNFTPNPGASLPALRTLARDKGVPHCGNDGKTGETLVKSVLAPMFRARALRVLAWQGYNMLGNRDGEALADPARREAKQRSKDHALRSILQDDELNTTVGIDYVPSLHDWKTAWDFVHFEGFLGTKMSLQFTWMGCDSALAAPLVLDLVRLADFAAARGESGEMEHTACYFKSPLLSESSVVSGGDGFPIQHQRLVDYVERHRPRPE